MFTGLVQSIGEVLRVQNLHTVMNVKSVSGIEITVATSLHDIDLALGASVCCNGVCLTVTGHAPFVASSASKGHKNSVTFYVGPETLAKTELGLLKEGDFLNLEPALRQGDPLGGHQVLGHVDGLGRVVSFTEKAKSWILVLELPPQHMDWVVPQGSIAVKGVSLTIAARDEAQNQISIMLIPHTLEKTNLSFLQAGQRVEVECDVQVKAIVQTIRRILPSYLSQTQSQTQSQAPAESATFCGSVKKS